MNQIMGSNEIKSSYVKSNHVIQKMCQIKSNQTVQNSIQIKSTHDLILLNPGETGCQEKQASSKWATAVQSVSHEIIVDGVRGLDIIVGERRHWGFLQRVEIQEQILVPLNPGNNAQTQAGVGTNQIMI